MSVEKLYEMLEDMDAAMLVTETEERSLRSRPMHVADVERDADLWFVTGFDLAGKLDEIDRRSDVNVALQNGGQYVSLSGRATVVDDRAKIADLWQKSWELWFPKGKEDPTIRLIKVTPSTAEYWDVSGAKRLQFMWEAGKALLTDQALDSDKIGEHEKVAL